MLLSLISGLTIQLAGIPEAAVQVGNNFLIKTHLNLVAWYDGNGNILHRQHANDACSSVINKDGSWAIGTPNYVILGSHMNDTPRTIPSNGCVELKVKTKDFLQVSVQIGTVQFNCDKKCIRESGIEFKSESTEVKVTASQHEYKFGNIKIKSHCEIKSAFQLTSGYLIVKRCGAMNFVDNKGDIKWSVEQGMTNTIDAVYFEQPAPKAMKDKLEHEDIVTALVDRYVTHFKILVGQVSFDSVKAKNLELLVLLSGPINPSVYVVYPNGTLSRKIMLFEEKGLELFESHKLHLINDKIVVVGSVSGVSTVIAFSVFKESLLMDKIIPNAHVIKENGELVISNNPSSGYKVIDSPTSVKGESLVNGKWETAWTMPVPSNFKLVANTVKAPFEQVAKYVIGDEVKFAPPHLRAYLWHDSINNILIVWGIDGKNGRSFVYGKLENAVGPFSLALSENFIYVTYQLVHDTHVQSVGVIYEMIFHNLPTSAKWSFDTVESPKVKMRQVNLEKGPFSASTITQTTKGVAFRDIIGILNLI